MKLTKTRLKQIIKEELENVLQEEIDDTEVQWVTNSLENVFEEAGFDWILDPNLLGTDAIQKALITLKGRSRSREVWGDRIVDFFKASADPNGHPPGVLAEFGIELKDDDGSDLINWEEFRNSIK
jgi:hypothetical protein